VRALRIVRELMRRQPLFVSVVAPLLALTSLLDAVPLIGFAPIIDLLIHPDLSQASPATLHITAWIARAGLPATLPVVATLFVSLLIVKSLVATATQLVVTKVNFSLTKASMTRILSSFLGAGWPFFVRNDCGTLGNTLMRETEKITIAFESTAVILANSLRLAAYLVIALLLSWKLTVLTLGLLGLALLPFFLLGRLAYGIGATHTRMANEFQGSVIETLSAAKLILGFGNQEKSLRKISDSLGPYLKSSVQWVMVRAVSPLAFEPLGFMMALTILYVGLMRFQIPLSSLFILLYILKTSSGLAMNVMNEKNRLENVAPALEQIDRLESEALRMVQPTGLRRFELLEREVLFEGVRFSYPDREETLKGVTVAIPKGRMTALVGRSGSGKTTFIDLLLGFYQPQAGRITVDGVPLGELDILSWRQRIGFVPQDPFLFRASIRENLLWANSEATPKEIEQARAAANATEFISQLPEGLDTVVGDRGVRLSGGQRQRIALARTLLRKPELLILDEATSALDSHSELMIRESVERLSKSVTVVAIAHRLSTIKSADRIYVLDKGSVVESGSFEQLMSINGGEFLKAAELQGLKPPPYGERKGEHS
jgi:ABC-type multidrug transport system fused ATPase/permease subunit